MREINIGNGSVGNIPGGKSRSNSYFHKKQEFLRSIFRHPETLNAPVKLRAYIAVLQKLSVEAEKSGQPEEIDFCARQLGMLRSRLACFGNSEDVGLIMPSYYAKIKKSDEKEQALSTLPPYTTGETAEKLLSTKFSYDETAELMSILATDIEGADEPRYNRIALRNTLLLKAFFDKYAQDNELKEFNNPIRKYCVGADSFVDGESQTEIVNEIRRVARAEIRERFLSLVDELSEAVISKIVAEYKSSDGTFDPKGRVIAVCSKLLKAGVSVNSILPLSKMCFNRDGTVNSETVAVLTAIQKAGAMSDEIQMLAEACKDKDENYDAEKVKTVCELTAARSGAIQIVEFLPYIEENPELLEFLKDVAPVWFDKPGLSKAVDFAREDGKINPVKAQILKYCADIDGARRSASILDDVTDYIGAITSPESGKPSFDGIMILKAFSEMPREYRDFNDVKSIAELTENCKNASGEINPTLAMLTNLLADFNYSVDYIRDTVPAFKDERGNVDETGVKMFIEEIKFPQDNAPIVFYEDANPETSVS